MHERHGGGRATQGSDTADNKNNTDNDNDDELWEEVALHELLGATTRPWVYAEGGSSSLLKNLNKQRICSSLFFLIQAFGQVRFPSAVGWWRRFPYSEPTRS